MPEDGFTLSKEDRDELRRRIVEREKAGSDFALERNRALETESPDDAAYDVRKANETGRPRQAIAADRDSYREQDERTLMERLSRDAPVTRKWLEQPDNYAVAKDDTESLSLIEKALRVSAALHPQSGNWDDFGKAFATIVPASRSAVAGVAASAIETPGITPIDAAITSNLDKVRGLDQAGDFAKRAKGAVRGPNLSGFRNPFDKGLRQEVKDLPGRVGSAFQNAREGASQRAIADAIASSERMNAAMPRSDDPVTQDILNGIASLSQMVPAMTAGVVSRRADVPMAIMGRQVYGMSYADALAEGLDPGGAALYAGAQSGIERATERAGLEILFGKNFVGKDYFKRFLASMATEQIQEQPATLGQDFVDWQVLNPEKTVDDFWAERGDRARSTAIATLVASGAMNSAVLGAEKVMIDMAEKQRRSQLSEGEKAIEDALKAAQNSKLAKRSPEKMQEAVGEMVAGSGVETLWVDLDGVVEILNQKGVDPGTVLEALGVDRDRLATDYDRFGESEIEFAKLMASPAVREHLEDIRPHLRTQDESYTPAQKEKIRNDLPNEIKRRMEQVQAQFEGTAELADREAQAAEKVRERILGAGIWGENKVTDANATLAAAMNNTFAKLAGMDPVDFYEAHFPRIQMSVDGMVKEQGGETKKARSARHRAEREALDAEFNDINEVSELRADVENTYARIKSGEASEELQRLLPEREARLRELEVRKAEWEQKHLDLLKRQKAEREGSTQDGVLTQQQELVDQGDQTHRGQFNTKENIITLFESRNYSTLMHEMSHWFLFQMEQFANEENAPPAIQKMWSEVNTWYDGLDRSKSFDPGSRERWVDMQESFAETFEVYLETGKAPSVGLRDAFRSFKSWLATLWKTVRGRSSELARANLDPQIVAVFDRMLATEEEINAATQQTYTEAETVAKGLLDAGILTQREYDRAIKNLDDAREAVKEEMMKRLMADMRREDEAWWRTERERIKADRTRSFDTSPVGRAWNWLGLGAYKGDVPVEESPGEAARADVEALYQTAAPSVETALDRARREAEMANAELDKEAQTVRQMLQEAAACAAGAAPAGVGQMVAGLGLATGAGIPLGIIAGQMTPQAQAERERRMKEWNLQEHQRLMREDPEYRAAHEQYDARRQAEYDNALAEYRAAREFEQKLEAYSDVDNMPMDSQFDMNSWTEQVSGVSGEFLDDLIGHEAAGDWNAEAGTSTAKGGGQFIDSTWLRLMRQHGPELGLDPGMSKEDMLALRTDRRWGTMMTAYYAMENRAVLEKKLDRPVTQKDAYLAHFLGATAAAKALTMDQDADAAKAFPAAAEANQNVFYKYGNPENPRTVGEMIERQTKGFSAEPLMVWDYPQMIGEADDGRVDR